MRFGLLALGIALLSPTARADVPFGTVAKLERIELSPSPLTATRVRLVGAFVSREGDHYSEGHRGFVELTCPVGHETECRAHWNAIANAIDAGDCVAFGWDVAPARVYAPGTAPSAPEYWAALRGVRVVTGDDDACSRAKNAPPSVTPEPIPTQPVPVVAPTASRRENWYGWQILTMALPSQAVFWTGYFAESPALVAIGLSGWGLTSPIIHGAVHGFVGRAFGGLAIESLAPLAAGGLVAAVASATGSKDRDVTDVAALGLLVGGVLGTAADALIGYEEVAIVPAGNGLALVGRF